MRIDPARQPEACSICGGMFVRTDSQAARGDKQCRSCIAARRAAQLAARAELGIKPKPKALETRRNFDARYRVRSDVRAKRAATERSRYRSENHRERIAARQAVKNAIRRGDLSVKPCEKCGEAKSEAHHPDYSKPLEVMWLCRPHHNAEHRAAFRGEQP